ncbi:flavin reductase family protein [Brevibacillus nitrificans]|uniref:flavin reductase family protein n=1 Tax=Brevibacillus nitrificans TaxID=651560 RepID=UPI00285B993F|nr:flavin reductase family protein [Brevibacillus nitrificans]MDR7315427.1 flavin reductase (DIM6/NTAB) family NADH-FMN oxidoreductase RutF [Brevibacillus nitrificans]
MISHITIHPKILYYGAPVILLSTENADGSTNISPISSSWALGSFVILGLGMGSQGLENLKDRPACVINLPDAAMWRQVEALASLTGKNPVPAYKQEIGFRYEKDKFAAGSFTRAASKSVRPERIAECPLQLEAEVRRIRIPEYAESFAIVETEVVQVHADERIAIGDSYVDPKAWNPLIYNFRHYFGLGEEKGKTYRSET